MSMGVSAPPYRRFIAVSACLHLAVLLLLPAGPLERLLSGGGGREIGLPSAAAGRRAALAAGIDLEVIEFELEPRTPAEPERRRERAPRPAAAAAAAAEQPEAPLPEELPRAIEVVAGEVEGDAPAVSATGSEAPAAAAAAAGTGAAGRQQPQAVLVPPVLVAVVWPDAPPEARRRRQTPVRLRVHVTAAGEVSEVEVVEPTSCPACEAAAVRAARRLRFRPAMRGATAVDAWVSYTVSFKR